MKKGIILISILSFFVMTLNAQEKKDTINLNKSIKYRAVAEYGQSQMYGDRFVTSPYHVIKTGMNIEIPLKYGFGVNTGLKYNYVLGKKESLYAHKGNAKYSYNGHLLDIPVRINYTLPIFWGLKIFVFTGVNLNIGLSQKETITFTQDNAEGITNTLNYPNSGTHNVYPDIYNRFNFQLGTGGGLQWRQFRIKSGYDWGLNDLYKNEAKKTKLKGWYLGFEYEF